MACFSVFNQKDSPLTFQEPLFYVQNRFEMSSNSGIQKIFLLLISKLPEGFSIYIP